MSSVVLDASALLAFLREEPGSERVESVLGRSVISSVSIAEVLTLALDHGGTLPQAFPAVTRLPITKNSFEIYDAYLAASLRPATKHLGLSLGDRVSLALGMRLGLPVLTTDGTWQDIAASIEIEPIR
jgi:PIN domain nuclease of toxin-antitoxin system